MRNRLCLISPKLRLVLSALLLAFSLCFLWSALHYSMPTRGLALQKATAELGLGPGDWVLCRPSLDYAASNAGGWYFSRRGDDFYIASPLRSDSTLWNAMIGPYPMAPLVPFALGFNPILDPWDEDYGVSDEFILVTTPDSAVVRVELHADGQVAHCTESAPGSGFWTGTLRLSYTEEHPPLLVRAYAADGALVGSFDP